MVTPTRYFAPESYFHIYNRGVAKQETFRDTTDYQRFLEKLAFYQQIERGGKFSQSAFSISKRRGPLFLEIVAFALMPNHFHLIVRANTDDGVTRTIANMQNSYTKYFNTRYERVGHLFQGPFKSVSIESDEQFIQVVRYVLLNPFVASLEETVGIWPWTAYREFFVVRSTQLSNPRSFLEYFPSKEKARLFINDHADYARSYSTLKKHALLE